MNQNEALKMFEQMCEVAGSDATEGQVNRLVDWMRSNIADAYIGVCADIAIESDCGDLYTAISEYAGESNVYIR